MLSQPALPHTFWAEAVKTAVHIINWSPNIRLGRKVPEEVWTGKPPSYQHLRVFGGVAYVHIRREERTKIEPKSQKCIFLGYGDSGEMGYRLWDLENRKIIRSKDVIFDETCMYKEPVEPQEPTRVIIDDDIHPGQLPEVENQPVQHENEPNNQAENDQPNVADDLPVPQIKQPNDGGLEAGQPAEVLRRSTRIRRPPARFDDFVMLTDCGEPSCYKEAL